MACTNRQFSGSPTASDPLRLSLSFNLLESYHSNLKLSTKKCACQRKMFPHDERPTRVNTRGKSLPPGGHPRVASLALRAIHLQVAPKGSEEECGQKPESSYNTSGLHIGPLQDSPLEQVFRWAVIVSYRPHSASVTKIGCEAPILATASPRGKRSALPRLSRPFGEGLLYR